MREYSANIGDALNYKVRLFAIEKSKREKLRAENFNDRERA